MTILMEYKRKHKFSSSRLLLDGRIERQRNQALYGQWITNPVLFDSYLSRKQLHN